jgi:hypothetical protein
MVGFPVGDIKSRKSKDSLRARVCSVLTPSQQTVNDMQTKEPTKQAAGNEGSNDNESSNHGVR